MATDLLICADCRRPFSLAASEARFYARRGLAVPTRCRACRYWNSVGGAPTGDQELSCVQCDSPFLFSAAEAGFYRDQGYVPPKHCSRCRRARRVAGVA